MRDAFEMKIRLPSTIVVVGIATALMIAIGFGLVLLAPVNPDVPDLDTASQFIPNYVGALHPKPRDRFMFMGMTIALAAVIACTAWTARKLSVKADGIRSIFGLTVCTVGVVTIAEGSFFGLQEQLGANLIICFIASLFWTVLSLAFNHVMRSISYLLIILVNTMISLCFRYLNISNISDLAQFTSHYEAVIYSIVKIGHRGTCLADVLPQYSCYGEFLAPILKIIGYSTSHMTAIFLILQVLATMAVFAFVRSMIVSGSLFLACTLCIVISTNLNVILGSPDPYFAYNPVRFLFPALSLPLVQWAQNNLSTNRAFILGLFAGLSLTWNLDSGVAILGALCCFCIAYSYAQWTTNADRLLNGLVGKLSLIVLGCATSCGLFVLYLFFKSRFSLHLSEYFTYQRLFYIAGFAMIPIPSFPSWWTIPAVIVGLVLLIICVRLTSPLIINEPVIERAGYLAALMVGLGIYFTVGHIGSCSGSRYGQQSYFSFS